MRGRWGCWRGAERAPRAQLRVFSKKLLRWRGVCFGRFSGVSMVGVDTRGRGYDGGRGAVGFG